LRPGAPRVPAEGAWSRPERGAKLSDAKDGREVEANAEQNADRQMIARGHTGPDATMVTPVRAEPQAALRRLMK
jgi:hypothetical protein